MSGTFLALRAAASSLIIRPTSHPHSLTFSCSLRHIYASSSTRTLKGDRFKRNGQIPFETVYVKNDETGELKEDKMSRILSTLDTKKHVVYLINPVEAIVRITTTDEFRESKARAKQAQKDAKKKEAYKRLLFSFNMAEHDRRRQMDRARKELGKGTRVDLLLAPKPDQKPPRYQDIKAIAQGMVDELADAGQEYKVREVKGRTAAIYLKPLASSSNAVAEDEEDGS